MEGEAGTSGTSNIVPGNQRARFTTKGTVRKRNIKWSPEERFVLFYQLSKQSSVLKTKGQTPECRKEAWELILGKCTLESSINLRLQLVLIVHLF